MTTGVETTTGPLGRGLGNSVGMAMAARWYENRFNKPDAPLFDYRVYALCGDGDMMEGISHEAASLAGHLKLSNLIWIYDSNRVTIEGHTDLAYSDDVESRFRGYNWHTLHVNDANDAAALEAAFVEAKGITDRPTLIVVNSIIGWGAPNKQDTASAHGEALGVQEVALYQEVLRLARRQILLCARRRSRAFRRRRSARAARRRAKNGRRNTMPTASSIPSSARIRVDRSA